MPRLLQIAVFAALTVIYITFGSASAFAERRVALVLGNSKYIDSSLALINPASDAQDLAEVLKQLGFDVTVALDATVRDMDLAIRRFGEQAATADTALFFYAGHALQYQGNNFLMPIDARLEDEVDLRRNMVSDEQIRVALEKTNGVRIMILDACRNNPLADRFKRTVLGMTRSTELTRGLARIDKAQGLVVAYAAAPGDVALDGGANSRNSPFTAALIKRMKEPALEISTMFRRVTNDVWDTTKGRQRPEYSSTLRNDYYLDPLADKRIWDRTRDLNDASAFREFINQFPHSPYVLDAQRRLDLLDRNRRERDEHARIERERQNAERARQELCRREHDELAAIGNDYAKLQIFAQSAVCDQVRAIANEKLQAIVAERQEALRRQEAARREEELRQQAERCRNERATVDLLWNDLNKLEEFKTKASCGDVRTLANDRAKMLVVQRELDELKRQEAERLCRDEQQTLAGIWNDAAKLQQLSQRAGCEQVRITAAERSKTVANLAAQRLQQEAAARQEAERLCQTEQAAAAAIWSDMAKLQELAGQAKCPEMKAAVGARVAALTEAQRQEQIQRQQALERLAALEEERNRQRREEERRKAEELAQQQAKAKCDQEGTVLATIESDISKLRDFVKHSECEDVRALTREKIAQFERAEQVCRDEDSKRDAFANQIKRYADRGHLERYKDEIAKFDLELGCARLKPQVAEVLTTARIKIAQVEMRRLGCYEAAIDGVLNEATQASAKAILAKLRLPENGAINEDFLSELKAQRVPICKPVPQPVAHNKQDPRPRKQAAPAPRDTARPAATAAAPKPASRPSISIIGIGN